MSIAEKINIVFNDFYGCKNVKCLKEHKKLTLDLIEDVHTSKIPNETAKEKTRKEHNEVFDNYIINFGNPDNSYLRYLDDLRKSLVQLYRHQAI